MDTPICDFVSAYQKSNSLRLHMPGHKGAPVIGPEALDITEIDGADVLYDAKGVILQSEQNAARLFGTAKTLYSTEGSSLCIRAMLYLTLLHARATGKKPLIAAARNAHKVFITAAALLDLDVKWLFSKENGSVVSCPLDLHAVEEVLSSQQPAALYVTSPDYLGHLADIRALSELCRRHDTLLLVDNAHGAYLKFLPESLHPIDLGADLCCDSAHKTLPVLTGGAYLHVSPSAPALLCDQAQNALSLFASTSPSYLILQSLDAANRYLADGYAARLADMASALSAARKQLVQHGYALRGDEPLKLTLAPKRMGYTGAELARLLEDEHIVCEFADPDFVVCMLTPETGFDGLFRLTDALLRAERRPAIAEQPPVLCPPQAVLRPHDALLSVQECIPASDAMGRVLASASVTCPPAVPIVSLGERIDESAIACFGYYGVEHVNVIC